MANRQAAERVSRPAWHAIDAKSHQAFKPSSHRAGYRQVVPHPTAERTVEPESRQAFEPSSIRAVIRQAVNH